MLENVTVVDFGRGFLKRLGRSVYIPFEEDLRHSRPEDVPNYFTEAVPVFFLVFLLECCVRFVQGFEKPLRINDAIVSVSAGIIFEIIRVFLWGFAHFTYVGAYDNFRLVHFDQNSFAVWCMSAVLMDFTYYWLHRAMHETSLMWATHHIHHSSDEFNVSTALRNSLTADLFAWIFWLPMALLGVPPTHFLTHHQFNLLFQFWIHTECVDRLPWALELILNTPSHHRVHHASNERYLDKNYGGSLIIWDRIFGTFLAEEEKPFYGITKPVRTFDPLSLQMIHYVETVHKMKGCSSLVDKIKAIFKPPSWIPPSATQEYVGKKEREKLQLEPLESTEVYDPTLPHWMTGYAAVHFVVVICAYQAFMYLHKGLGFFRKLVAVVFLFASLTTIAAVLENKRTASVLEGIRCAVTATFLSVFFAPEIQLLNSNSSPLFYLDVLRHFYIYSAVLWFTVGSKNALFKAHGGAYGTNCGFKKS